MSDTAKQKLLSLAFLLAAPVCFWLAWVVSVVGPLGVVIAVALVMAGIATALISWIVAANGAQGG